MDKSQKRAIRNLLSVLFTAFAVTIALVGYMLWHYNPDGLYQASSTLLTAEVAKNMSFKETNSASGSRINFVFDEIEFAYRNSTTGDWKPIKVDLQAYSKFFDLVKDDRSLSAVEIEEAVKLFSTEQPATLALKLRNNSAKSAGENSMIFQEVQFDTRRDFYRVNLHEQTATATWAYFHHDNVYKKIIQIFDQPENRDNK